MKFRQIIIYKEKQRGCPLLGENKYTHIYIYQIYMCIYMIYLFETIVSKAWPSLSVFFFFNYTYNFPWGHYLVHIESYSLLLSS